jgi:2,3-bisphosphoglycerate-dependent phosphoglycerate mutase
VLTLHLLRHGQSTWNARGRLQGHTAHVRLTALGRRQACAAARALAAAPVTAVWSSDLRRAWETAELVAAAHGVPVRAEPGLREQAHGAFEGQPIARVAPVLAAADPDWAPPGGESARRLHARVAALLDRLPAAGELVLVTHGETLRAAVAVLAGRPAEAMDRVAPGNGTVLTARRAAPGAPWATLTAPEPVWSSSC